MTKFQIASAMFSPYNITVTISGVTGRIISVEREDGSGHSFNIRMWSDKDNKAVTVYVKTID